MRPAAPCLARHRIRWPWQNGSWPSPRNKFVGGTETLKRAGIDFTVYEKAGEVGGTWRDNTFPGLFVDVLSRQYEFPFQPNYGWSRKYAPAEEIFAYVKRVARDRGLHKFIRFNEEIVSARFT